MKTRASIWLVATFLLLTIGLVYALSTTTPPQPGVPQVAGSQAAGNLEPRQSTPVEVANAPETKPTFSPDLSQANGYDFLDPVPVGKSAPDFTASSAEGRQLKLSDYKGKKNVVLVFYQGSFCSVCAHQLSNFQKHLSDFKSQDAEILAISADDLQHARQSVGEHGLSFTVIPDHDKQIIKKFGVANISKQGIAWPSLFIVDKSGSVRLSYASAEGHRLHSSEVLPELSKITGKPAPSLGYDE